jgi:hypothetical protein
MTPSSLWSTHHGHVHITLPLCQNWTTHPLHLLLHRHPSLPVPPLPLSRAPWKSTTSPDKPFPIKHRSSRMRLQLRKCTCLSHIVKRGRTALHSEFFGPYPDHSDTHHHHHQQQQQHHVASHKCLCTVLHSRGDASCWHRSRPSRLHKSASRFYYIVPFFISFSHHCFSPLFGYTDVCDSRIIFFAHRSCYHHCIHHYLVILPYPLLSEIKIAGIAKGNSNMIDDESQMNVNAVLTGPEPEWIDDSIVISSFGFSYPYLSWQ